MEMILLDILNCPVIAYSSEYIRVALTDFNTNTVFYRKKKFTEENA